MNKVNHNPNNVKAGERAVLDKDSPVPSIVVIKSITPKQLLSTVYSPDNPKTKWDVMTDRLSKLYPLC